MLAEFASKIAELEIALEQIEKENPEEVEQEQDTKAWEEVFEKMPSEYNGELFAKVIEKVVSFGDNTMEIIIKKGEKKEFS